jgi:hypothetical protein
MTEQDKAEWRNEIQYIIRTSWIIPVEPVVGSCVSSDDL